MKAIILALIIAFLVSSSLVLYFKGKGIISQRELSFDEAVSLHKAGKIECTGTPNVLSVDVKGNVLVVLTGSDMHSTYIFSFFREKDVWPEFIMAGVPLLICRDRNGKIVWVGHAGFEGQKSIRF